MDFAKSSFSRQFADPPLSNWLFVQGRIRTKCICHDETKDEKLNKTDLLKCRICCYLHSCHISLKLVVEWKHAQEFFIKTRNFLLLINSLRGALWDPTFRLTFGFCTQPCNAD